jgi:hypothetical protein
VVFAKAARVFWRVLLVVLILVHKMILLFKWTPEEQEQTIEVAKIFT